MATIFFSPNPRAKRSPNGGGHACIRCERLYEGDDSYDAARDCAIADYERATGLPYDARIAV
jgi:hypothetical protein